MEYNKRDILKEEFAEKIVPVAEFARQKGVQNQAMTYAMNKDLVDWVEIGPRNKYIVLTEKSINYEPNASPKRSTLGL